MNQIRSPKSISNSRFSAREKAYGYMKSAIFSGRFRPGERLTEERLAGELGVSRTPIREAFHKLEQDGFIVPLETRGFCIPKDSPQEVEDLFALRTVLEGYALRLICDRITDDEIGTLEKMIDQAENALRLGKIDEVFHWNTMFHDTLHGMIEDKRRFHSFIVNMRKYVLRYRKSTLQHLGAGNRTVNGHRQILLSLKLRDPELCERVMRSHIREAAEDALSVNHEEV